MPWLEGLLGGFTQRKREVEQQELEESHRAAEREGKIFETLLSSPDPEIQALATTGLLESARPRRRKGGLRGWMGELESSPTFGHMQKLIQTPVERPGTPSRQLPSEPLPPGPSGEVGIPPPGTPDEVWEVGRAPTLGPRQIFLTPEEQTLRQKRAASQGDVEGEITGLITSGFGEDEARALIKEKYERQARGTVGFQSIAGEMPDDAGQMRPAFGVLDRRSGQYLDPNTRSPLAGFRPRTTTGSRSLGADRESIAKEMFGVTASQLNPQQMERVNQTLITRQGETAFSRGAGTGRAKIQTELRSPIGPTAAQLYNVSPTTTLGELEGIVGLDPVQKERVYALNQLDVLIDDIDELIPKVFPNVEPGIRGAIKSTFQLGMKRLGRDVDMAALDASINGALAQVAQLSGQPGSKLSDIDLALARSELANLNPSLFGGDTLRTAQARIAVVRRLMDRANASIPTSPKVGPKVGTPPPGASAAPAGGALTGFTVDKQGNLLFNGKPAQ